MKYRYLLNSFAFQLGLFRSCLSDRFDFTFTPPGCDRPERMLSYAPRNYLHLKKMYARGEVEPFGIVHFNRVEAFLAFKKMPRQISVFEIHGYDIGVMGREYLKDLHTPWKRAFGLAIDRAIEKRVIAKLQEPDILYVSTPDLIEPIAAWCGRQPEWLPNPIDVNRFRPDQPAKQLAGHPACLLAARLHGDKKPELAISIFKNDILPKYPDAVLYLIESGELVQKYKRLFGTDPHYSWLPYMDKPTLASVILGADLVFGDFAIGALSMLPMQVMAAKRPIVTLDRYEIVKKEIEELPALALRLLEDEPFLREFVEREYEYVRRVHAPEQVCEKHLARLRATGKLDL